jgi:hypothetical protein
MDNTKKIVIGVSGLIIVGLGVFLITRKKSESTSEPDYNENLADPSTITTDSLGTQIGNLFTTLIANWQKKKNNDNNTGIPSDCDAPADPYTADGIDKADYDSSRIMDMQNSLIGFGEPIKGIIDGSGGADGIIGIGFKQAYNTARKSCFITGINEL